MQNEKVARLATENMAKTARTVSDAAQTAAQNGAENARQAAEAGAAQASKVSESMFQVAQSGVERTQAALQAGSAQAQKTTEGMLRAAGEAAEFSRGNFEALTQAAQAYAAGAQDLSRQTFALMQSLGEHTLEGAKAVAGSRSMKEAAEIQANYLRQAMERLMGETARLQEAGYRLAEQTTAPITQRVTLAMERAGKPLAL